ncbi:MAG: hypothetical protein RLZZ427_170 [Pseudomonadota bacterium]|jgi:hypothetical protein
MRFTQPPSGHKSAGQTIAAKRGAGTAAVMLASVVVLLALPSAVLAFSSRFDVQSVQRGETAALGFQPASVDPRLARSITVRALSKGRSFRFTPAATASRMDRSLTVAVRLDANTTRSYALRGGELAGGSALRIAPTAYSLGTVRGYRSFAQAGGSAPMPGADIRRIEMPDLASYRPRPGVAADPSRFAPRIALDEREKSGRSPRTFEQSDQTVDVGGSYRVTGNLNVTAGVRYSSDRDRLVPLTDGRQDSQSVYLGTQFRF